MQPLQTLAEPELHLANGQHRRHHTTAYTVNRVPSFNKAATKIKNIAHDSENSI